MSGENSVDQCPFCNAPWGTCAHARLLAEWEAEALARESQASREPRQDGLPAAKDETAKPVAGIGIVRPG